MANDDKGTREPPPPPPPPIDTTGTGVKGDVMTPKPRI